MGCVYLSAVAFLAKVGRMHIERVQVEEGFLDGMDLGLVPGLNVLIGARGTGKTSLIELIRFCLNAHGHTAEAGKRSRDHAMSVLGAGQVTVTLRDGGQRMVVTRTANDTAPRATGPFTTPIVFSQTEIETVGLQPAGRLRLLDGFVPGIRPSTATESAAAADVRSLTAEAETMRREIEELNGQIGGLKAIDEQLAALAPSEQGIAKSSNEAAAKKKVLDGLSAAIASHSVATEVLERFRQSVFKWKVGIANSAGGMPATEPWPSAGGDPLAVGRTRIVRAADLIRQALEELAKAEEEAMSLSRSSGERKIAVEEQARQLRKEIEALQVGAGAVTRQGQQLRERKAQLESLKPLASDRTRKLADILRQRAGALDRLDAIREERFTARQNAANRLSQTLGPKIHLSVSRSGQFEAFSAAISEILKGTGLRYNDLAPVLAKQISPRELLEAADTNDVDLVVEAAGISQERASRVLTQIKNADLGKLATAMVDDKVDFQLLDGPDYKDIADLSTGQRCTVILPLVLCHTDRLLIVDQPEDHIDNAFIADTLILSVLARDSQSQTLFSTHNANIPVLGNADRVIQLGSDGRRGFVLVAAALDDPHVVSAITTVMEGGARAFERRAAFYAGRRQP
jgi:ABC-type lipoprotein export system ATPase subunit